MIACARNNYAIEVKNGNKKSNIYDSLFQTIGYWNDYVTDNIDYQIDIDGFLAGTQYSIDGSLFHPQYQIPLKYQDLSQGRLRAIEMKELPPREDIMTEQFTRILWRAAKQHRPKSDIGIGTLLSGTLEKSANWPAGLMHMQKQTWRKLE